MAEFQAAVLGSLDKPTTVERKALPKATQGQVVVKVLATYILPYLKAVLEGKIPYTLSLPIVPCASTIARVESVGPDATVLQQGQLVLCDMTIRARDEPTNVVLQGLHGGATPDLMAQWAQGSFAEYAVFPMESVFALNEERLCTQLGYSIEDLCLVPICNVPFGGLATIDVKPGETVLVAPATGKFGGAAVLTALAMGARVIAVGRTQSKLDALTSSLANVAAGRLHSVALSGDADADATKLRESAGANGADCYVDFSPLEAGSSTHVAACLGALRPHGRAVFNGGSLGSVTIPYLDLMLKSLRLQGRYMYERKHTVRLIQMIEAGLLPLGKKINFETVGAFDLAGLQDGLVLAEKETGWGKQVVLKP